MKHRTLYNLLRLKDKEAVLSLFSPSRTSVEAEAEIAAVEMSEAQTAALNAQINRFSGVLV